MPGHLAITIGLFTPECIRGRFLLIGEVEKVLPQFFVADWVRRLAIVLGQLANGGHIRFLSPFGQAPQLHVLDHSLA